MEFINIFMLCCGLGTLIAAQTDWDWVWNHGKTKMVVKFFGRRGARIFYTISGVVLIYLGFNF